MYTKASIKYVPTLHWEFGIGWPKTDIPIPRINLKKVLNPCTERRVGKTHSIAWLKIEGVLDDPSTAKLVIYFIDDNGQNSPDRTETPDRRLRKALRLPTGDLSGGECLSYKINLPEEQEFSVSAMRVARKVFKGLGLSKDSIPYALSCFEPKWECFVRQKDIFVPFKDIVIEKNRLSKAQRSLCFFL